MLRYIFSLFLLFKLVVVICLSLYHRIVVGPLLSTTLVSRFSFMGEVTAWGERRGRVLLALLLAYVRERTNFFLPIQVL